MADFGSHPPGMNLHIASAMGKRTVVAAFTCGDCNGLSMGNRCPLKNRWTLTLGVVFGVLEILRRNRFGFYADIPRQQIGDAVDGIVGNTL